MPEPSIIDERLAEIDRRLRTIQTGLRPVDPPSAPAAEDAAPASGSASASVEPEPEPVEEPLPPPTPLRPAPTPAELALEQGLETVSIIDRLRTLSEAHDRLLELHRELLSQYAEGLARRVTEGATAAVTAGPFPDAAALRAFEHGLSELPAVTAVTVREYLGADRVALDVHLAHRAAR
jgi:hypothetical protein